MLEAQGANTRISLTAKVYPHVVLGNNVTIDDFCIVGYPTGAPEGQQPPTIIGDNCHIRSHTVIYSGVEIGNDCKISHSTFIREQTTIGNNVSVGMNVVIEHHCVVGDNVRIQGQAGLAEYTVVERDAWIGPRTLTANVFHPTCEKAKVCLAGPTIREGAIIGGNCFIAPDVEIGPKSFVGAGSVVTKAVEPKAMVFGVPAKNIGSTDRMRCQFDLVSGSPYRDRPAEPAGPPPIPLVDLSAQNQPIKLAVRLAMDRVVANTRFILGKEVKEFEDAFAAYCGTGHMIGVGSGTSALKLSLVALGVQPGDEVIAPANSFIATASAICAVGARPVLVDVDEGSSCMDPAEAERAITPRTKAIMPVHLYGQLADMDRIGQIAAAHDIRVIEDAAQAHGARVGSRRAGQWGNLGCFSFFPGKNLGAYGDAGAVVTSDPDLAAKVRMLRNHGRSDKYQSDILGENERMDTIQAAVLGVKLRQLEKWNDSRRAIASRYRRLMDGLPVELPPEPSESHVFHLFVIRTVRRDELATYLQARGIGIGIHYPVPLHLQPALRYLGHAGGSFPVTERLASQILSLPMFPDMKDEQVERVASAVRSFFEGSGG